MDDWWENGVIDSAIELVHFLRFCFDCIYVVDNLHMHLNGKLQSFCIYVTERLDNSNCVSCHET